jgi:formylglycine-generating enzyme required for sulfatase activity
MKKTLQSLILLLAALLPQTASAYYLQGDVNYDGYVDINDVTLLIDILLGNINLPETETFTVNGVTFTMVTVEGGTFTMGATAEQDGDAGSEEYPAHQVTLSSYSIGQTEVTQELWQAVMGSNPSVYQGNLQWPVQQVSWEDCQAFVAELNELTGKTFRLPTEAEWEFAARGGNKSQGYKYAGSNDIDEVAWYGGYAQAIQPVAIKVPNELGIYDMSGNVYEWCQDWWYNSYPSGAQINPTGPASGSLGVNRGGSFGHNAWSCRVSHRKYYGKGGKDGHLGLRLAL